MIPLFPEETGCGQPVRLELAFKWRAGADQLNGDARIPEFWKHAISYNVENHML